jgi:negative regulator of sigma-B (phosphoserine phosphatase)
MAEHGWLGPIDWAAARRARPGESVCGDDAVALDVTGGAALFAVLDGLGHGAAAAEAAQLAAQVLHRETAEPLDVLIQRCHRALVDTRGAAMTLVRIDFGTETLRWIGIGNVTAVLVAKAPRGVELRSSALLTGGIVGYRIPESLQVHDISIGVGDLLVMASDGIDENYLASIDFAAPAAAIAEDILRQHAKDSDDALVLAARHRGSPS